MPSPGSSTPRLLPRAVVVRRHRNASRLRVEALEDRLTPTLTDLGVAAAYNAFILDTAAIQNTDVAGRFAVGSDATLSHVGITTGQSGTGFDGLVVGEDLTFTSGQIYFGGIAYGGTATLTNVGIPNGDAHIGAPINFAAAKVALYDLSSAWAALAANGTVESNAGTYSLTGTNEAQNIFNLTSAALAGVNTLQINAPAGSAVVINVWGSTAALKNFGMFLTGTNRQHVVFNFPDATALEVGGVSVQGSILAPKAQVAFNNGNIEGTLVADDVSGDGEYHDFRPEFVIDVPTPCPATLAGSVYVDTNGNGCRDKGEAGIRGVTVILTGEGVTRTAETGSDGWYKFTDLAPGIYTVTECQPDRYVDGDDRAGTAGGSVGNDVVSDIILGAGKNATGYDFGELKPACLSGQVYVDSNNSGTRQASECGIAGVKITLTGIDDRGECVTRTTTTLANGTYSFTGLRPGIYTVTECQPDGYIDGKDRVGNAGGMLANDEISRIKLNAGTAAACYLFGELETASLAGSVYVDGNNNGTRQANESGIGGVKITLTGTDDRGIVVTQTTTTSADGNYSFTDLRPGTYAVIESQPAGYTDGKDRAGTAGGSTNVNDKITGVVLKSGTNATGYLFGENLDCNPIQAKETATIGYWHNKNGQGLIKRFNGDANSTRLSTWLAATFPNAFGASAGANNLTGMTNTEVADYYANLFDNNPAPKAETQMLAVAFNVYATTATLCDGTTDSPFSVTAGGLGARTWVLNATEAAAFGLSAGQYYSVQQLLSAADSKAVNGSLYSGNSAPRGAVAGVFSGINEAGHV